MKLSWFGRLALALFASLALGLGMSACGGGTIAYLWVLGQQYNQIASFKVDDFTGNLTQTPHQPFASQGANPVTILVKAGGRFVYVLNQGASDTPTSDSGDAGVAVFSVGGDGTLNYLQSYHSQGFQPVWMQFDATNSYLYVLDKYSPNYKNSGNGSLTAFSIDPTTGRLTLVLNTQSVPPNSPAPTYWEVGQNPLQMKQAGSCLFTVNSADQSITPYSLGGGGQLVNVTTGKIATSASNISSINGNGSYVILTDNGNNTILPYSIGSSCTLNLTLGGVTQNQPGTTNPTLLVHLQQQQVPVHPQSVDDEHHGDPGVQLHYRIPHSAEWQPRQLLHHWFSVPGRRRPGLHGSGPDQQVPVRLCS